MNNIIYRNACAYKEIYEILKIFPDELVSKIPKSKIDFFYNNMDKSYDYYVSKDSFDWKNMLEETVAILIILYRDYWATPEQKEILIEFIKTAQSIVENENNQKYNLDDLFKDWKEDDKENIQQALIETKESIFVKIINKIKKIFKIK